MPAAVLSISTLPPWPVTIRQHFDRPFPGRARRRGRKSTDQTRAGEASGVIPGPLSRIVIASVASTSLVSERFDPPLAPPLMGRGIRSGRDFDFSTVGTPGQGLECVVGSPAHRHLQLRGIGFESWAGRRPDR